MRPYRLCGEIHLNLLVLTTSILLNYTYPRSRKYEAAGLSVSLISPSADNYATTPAKKLSSGQVDFCLCPSESIISFQDSKTPLTACAALLDRDASAIISRTAKRPAELVGAGKTYASYGAR